jgi:hypothetical protein
LLRLTSTLAHIPAVVVGALTLGCGPGGSPAAAGPKAPVTTPSSIAPAPPAPTKPKAEARMQGTWEIARYESVTVIPDEAMPLMGALFNMLRLEFTGAVAIARIENVEERASFVIESEAGDEFTLFARGWMFDGARCRFTSEGEIEIKDKAGTWPGVSRLRRVP